MPLTRRQKSRLWGLFAVFVILGVFGGLGYFAFWTGETSSVTHYCSGGAGITISRFNDGTQSANVKFNDPKCR